MTDLPQIVQYDDLLARLIARIGAEVRVGFSPITGRWTADALTRPGLRGPGSATAPTLALAMLRLADRADAIREQCEAEDAASDAA
jgi:hypothetical protein